MPKWQLPDPKDLTKARLAEIVTSIQDFMYAFEIEDKDGIIRRHVLPDGDVVGSDLVEVVGDLMFRYNLIPEEVRSKKDWRP